MPPSYWHETDDAGIAHQSAGDQAALSGFSRNPPLYLWAQVPRPASISPCEERTFRSDARPLRVSDLATALSIRLFKELAFIEVELAHE